MLYGRTNSSQLWELKRGGEELLFRGNNKVLPIPGLLKGLNVALGMELFFYVFSFKKEFRFVFVATDEIDFKRLSSPKVRGTGAYSIMVKGALYDLEKKEFIFNKAGNLNYFVIYDYGIPNVIYNPENGTHIIFSLDGDGEYSFYTTKVRNQPILISHLWKKKQVGRPINNRLIFFNSDGKIRESMMILHEEVLMESLNEDVNFVETITLNDETDSMTAYFYMVHGRKAQPDDVYVGIDSQYHLHLLTSSDAIVVEQSYEDYNIVFVNGEGHFVYSDDYDCFNYKKVFPTDGTMCTENQVKVYYRKNDFENGTSIFNISTGKVD